MNENAIPNVEYPIIPIVASVREPETSGLNDEMKGITVDPRNRFSAIIWGKLWTLQVGRTLLISRYIGSPVKAFAAARKGPRINEVMKNELETRYANPGDLRISPEKKPKEKNTSVEAIIERYTIGAYSRNNCSPNVDMDRTTESIVVRSAMNENNAYPPRNFPTRYDGFEIGLVNIMSAVPCSYSSAVDPEPIKSATN
jgi:hypothetical protein